MAAFFIPALHSAPPRPGWTTAGNLRIGSGLGSRHRRNAIELSRFAEWVGLALVGVLVAVLVAVAAGRADEDAAVGLTRALAAEETRTGKLSPALLPVIDELAQARLGSGDLTEAAALRRRALDIAVAAFGCDSAKAAEAMAALARVHIDRRRYLDAEPLLIVAERVMRDRGAADHPALAAILAGLARVALARGETDPAIAWAGRSVDIARADPQGRSAEPLRTLGAALAAARRFDDAKPVLSDALAQDRRQHGAEHPETARSLSQLGNLHLRQGRAGEGLPLFAEAAAIDQARLGPTHPFIADDLHDLGLAYEALKRDDQALLAYLAALAVLERGAGRDTPRVAYVELELSRLYRRKGDAAAAEAAFRNARRILNKAEAEERRRERRV